MFFDKQWKKANKKKFVWSFVGIGWLEDAGVMFSNDIYKEIVPHVLNNALVLTMSPSISPQWFINPMGKTY